MGRASSYTDKSSPSSQKARQTVVKNDELTDLRSLGSTEEAHESKTQRTSRKESWTDQEAELEALREAIFPRSTKFPFDQGFPGGDGWKSLLDDCADVQGGDEEEKELEAGLIRRILNGKAKPADIQERRTIVRFFVSSTFTDTKYERDAFFAFCVPYLRTVCRKRGLEFQVSEMRWGINDGLSQSHQTSAICMRELQRCVDESASIQFVGILGDKYGYRPFPCEIEKSLFEELLENVPKKDLFEKWFRLDENAVPNVYVLQPVQDIIPNYNPNVFDKFAKHWWSECFEPMQDMLRKAAVKVSKKKNDPAIALPFVQSVTEDEMHRGFNGKNKTLLIVRELQPSGEENNSKITDKRYIDAGDEEAQSRLKNLKRKIIEKASSTGEILKYEVPWFEGGIDPFQHAEHAAYLRNVLTDWTRAVERSIKEIPHFKTEPIVEEVQEHLRFAHAKAKDFIGRDPLVQELKKAIQTSQTVVVQGISGSGKTSLLSKVALQAATSNSGVTCIRFLGTTLASKSAFTVIHSLCQQISRAYGGADPQDLPSDLHSLVSVFVQNYLTMATAMEPLLIVLDSLDQLTNAEDLSWLPNGQSLPPHVTLVTSTLPYLYESGVKAKRFQSHITVEPIQKNQIKPVLDRWLKSKKRALSKSQRQQLLKVIERAKEPTYLLLRILFNEAQMWKSYSSVPKTWETICDAKTAVDALFDRIEAEHGMTFVRAALSFLTATRDGLTSNELEDLLSLDDIVLKECFQWWVPPVARIPPLLPTRLLDSLKEYVVSQYNNWFHRQFRETAERRYVDDTATYVHLIADYFADTVSIDPYMLHEQGRHHVRLSTNRRIQGQPMVLENNVYNKRKLRELPQALLKTGRFGECLEILQSPTFCRGIFALNLEQELLDNLKDPRLPNPDRRKFFHRALMQCRNDVSQNHHILEEQLWARLVPVLGDEDGYVKMLNEKRHECPGLHARYSNIYNAANSSLLSTHRDQIGSVEALCEFANEEHNLVLSASKNQCNMWDPVLGRKEKSITLSCDISSMAYDPSHELVCFGLVDSTLALYNSRKWTQDKLLQGHTACVNDVTFIPEKEMIVSCSSDGTVRVFDCKTGKELASLNCHFEPVNTVKILHSHPKSTPFIISGSDDRQIAIIDVEANFNVLHVQASAHEGAIYALATLPTGENQTPHLISGSFDGQVKVWRFNPSSGDSVLELLSTLNGHQGGIKALVGLELAPGSNLIISGSTDNSIILWDDKFKQVARLTGHSNSIHSLCTFSASDNRKLLLSGSMDNSMKTWEINAESHAADNRFSSNSGAHTHSVTSTCSIVTKERVKLIASCSSDKTVKLWDAQTGNAYCTFEGHKLAVIVLATIRNAQGNMLIVSGSRDETIRFWDPDSRGFVHSIDGFTGDINGLVTHESWVIYASEKTVRMFDFVSRSTTTLTGHKEEIRAVCVFTVNGKLKIASGCGRDWDSTDNLVRIFDFSTKAEERALDGHSAKVNTICALTYGKQQNRVVLASGSDDKSVCIWCPEKGTLLKKFQDHNYPVCLVSPVMDMVSKRTFLVTSAVNDPVHCYSIDSDALTLCGTCECMPTQEPRVGIRPISTKDGRGLVVIACRDNSVRVFSACDGQELTNTTFPGTLVTAITPLEEPGEFSVGCQNGRVTAFDLSL